MSKFITGVDLEETIYNIIWETERVLLIVSPYIKLDNYFKQLFEKHQNNPKIHLILVFGKNELDIKRSMSQNDFEFFKKFPNVSIIYVPTLHAKYYGNERKGVITSINLYDYSFKNNIEFGVSAEVSLLDRFRTTADNEAWNVCLDLAESSEVVFIKRPVYEIKRLIINLGKSYIKSDILFDSTDKFYGDLKNHKSSFKRLHDFPEELELGISVIDKPERINDRPDRIIDETQSKREGYCIRSGSKIKFNPKQPMTRESWKIWNEYGNPNFPEKYCHKTGKLSNGKTSMNNPIMYIRFSSYCCNACYD